MILIPVLVILTLNLLVYTQCIFHGLVVDDVYRVEIQQRPKGKKQWLKAFWQSLHTSRWWSLPLKLEHGISVFIHLVNCILIYFVFGMNEVSFLTACLFSIVPSNNQVPAWMNGKRYGIACMLILIAWAFKPWTFVFYIFTPFWQYGAILFPIIAILRGYWWLILFFPLLFLIKFTKTTGGRDSLMTVIKYRLERNKNTEQIRIHPKKLILYFKSYGYFLFHALFPRRMAFFHMFLESFGLSEDDNKFWYKLDWRFWSGLASFILINTLMVIYWNSPIGLGLLWYTTFVFVWQHLPYTITMTFADRYLYLPNVGLFLAVSYGILQIPSLSVKTGIICSLGAYYLTMLLKYLPKFKHEVWYNKHNLAEFPDQFRVYHIMSQMCIKKQMWCHSIYYCAEGLYFRPRDYLLNFYMSVGLATLGQPNQAYGYLQTAKENMVPGHEESLTDMLSNHEKELNKMFCDCEKNNTSTYINEPCSKCKKHKRMIVKPKDTNEKGHTGNGTTLESTDRRTEKNKN